MEDSKKDQKKLEAEDNLKQQMEVLGFSEKELRKRNEEIEKLLKSERKKLDKMIKLLLLGTGESGKSTIAKQMKILHLQGFSDAEKKEFKSIICKNIFASIRTLIEACRAHKIPFESSNEEIVEEVLNASEKSLDPNLAKRIARLWTDSGIQEAYKIRSQFQLMDSAAYFLSSVETHAKEDYIPTEQDILRSRVQTSGVVETEFVIDQTVFHLVDVGGQRGERKKWIHFFSDVTAVLFCVALSEYDLNIAENNVTNRMQESLQVFSSVVNDKYLQERGIILFLNKKDIFEEKIKVTDLNVCFPNYTDGKDYDKAVAYITKQFTGKTKNPKTTIYAHVVTATDTDNIARVWAATKDIILRTALHQMGMMEM